jgi:hypothetical protein
MLSTEDAKAKLRALWLPLAILPKTSPLAFPQYL